MYVYAYVYICVHAVVYINAYIYTYVCTHIFTCIRTYMDTMDMHLHMSAYSIILADVCMYTRHVYTWMQDLRLASADRLHGAGQDSLSQGTAARCLHFGQLLLELSIGTEEVKDPAQLEFETYKFNLAWTKMKQARKSSLQPKPGIRMAPRPRLAAAGQVSLTTKVMCAGRVIFFSFVGLRMMIRDLTTCKGLEQK